MMSQDSLVSRSHEDNKSNRPETCLAWWTTCRYYRLVVVRAGVPAAQVSGCAVYYHLR